MEQTIIVRPNQSLLDIILQGCGTMEAGMRFSIDNNIPLSWLPNVDRQLVMSVMAIDIADAVNLQYLQKNGIVIGTLGSLDDSTPYIPEDGAGDYVTEDGSNEFVTEGS